MAEFDDGRAVGHAEGYIEGLAEAESRWTIVSCICGVITGGYPDRRKGCPMHDPATQPTEERTDG